MKIVVLLILILFSASSFGKELHDNPEAQLYAAPCFIEKAEITNREFDGEYTLLTVDRYEFDSDEGRHTKFNTVHLSFDSFNESDLENIAVKVVITKQGWGPKCALSFSTDSGSELE